GGLQLLHPRLEAGNAEGVDDAFDAGYELHDQSLAQSAAHLTQPWVFMSASPSSRDRLAAASTASMSVVLTPPDSRVCRPVMAVPPGDVTMSLSRPGCSLVSRRSLAEPSTVCAARSCAVRRDR